jgi:carbon monoxide dehydrogenase subunit G
MRLENEFLVSAPLEQTWLTLLDIERVATCLPGATVQPADADGVFRGGMKMKLGPVTVDYQGTARMLDLDEDEHVATMEARAKETRGQGTASATITNRLTRDGDRTRVTVQTDLNVTGRQAQFGRGIMQDVAERMLGEFAVRLEREILSGSASKSAAPAGAGPGAGAAVPAAVSGSPAAVAESEPLDLGNVVTGPLLKRAAPIAAGGLLAALLVLVLRRGRTRKGLSLTFSYR